MRCVTALLLLSTSLCAQPWSAYTTVWNRAGARSFVQPASVVEIDTLGADPTGATPSDVAFQRALSLLPDGGTLRLGTGTYLLRSQLVLRSRITLQGRGADVTRIVTDVPNDAHPIVIAGGVTRLAMPITSTLRRGDAWITGTGLQPERGAMLRIVPIDSNLMFSDWGRGSSGQIIEVREVRGDSIYTTQPLRMTVDTSRKAYLALINPVEHVRIRCLSIEQRDSSAQQVSNIFVSYARDIVIDGVRSRKTNFAHVTFEYAMHCTVTRCDIAESYGYGGGGRGYGVVLQFASGDCRIVDNVFSTLRHSMLMQAGANGNVLCYNASQNPRWTEFPNDAAGDVVWHGNWVYANLVEGNSVSHIVLDNSHGANGWHNIILRNHAREYGLFMGSSPPTDSTCVMGNVISNTSLIKGLFTAGGAGLLSIGNRVKGLLTPANDTTSVPRSLAYTLLPEDFQRDPIPARARQTAGGATCPCQDDLPTSVVDLMQIGIHRAVVRIYDIRGQLLWTGSPEAIPEPLMRAYSKVQSLGDGTELRVLLP